MAAVLEACESVETDAGVVPLDGRRESIRAAFASACDDGLRVIAVAYRPMPGTTHVSRATSGP